MIGVGIDSVLGCLRQNLCHAKIQEMGCWALVNMALRSSHKQALLHGGVIQVRSTLPYPTLPYATLPYPTLPHPPLAPPARHWAKATQE